MDGCVVLVWVVYLQWYGEVDLDGIVFGCVGGIQVVLYVYVDVVGVGVVGYGWFYGKVVYVVVGDVGVVLVVIGELVQIGIGDVDFLFVEVLVIDEVCYVGSVGVVIGIVVFVVEEQVVGDVQVQFVGIVVMDCQYWLIGGVVDCYIGVIGVVGIGFECEVEVEGDVGMCGYILVQQQWCDSDVGEFVVVFVVVYYFGMQ